MMDEFDDSEKVYLDVILKGDQRDWHGRKINLLVEVVEEYFRSDQRRVVLEMLNGKRLHCYAPPDLYIGFTYVVELTFNSIIPIITRFKLTENRLTTYRIRGFNV